jgi:hypothetical protein
MSVNEIIERRLAYESLDHIDKRGHYKGFLAFALHVASM